MNSSEHKHASESYMEVFTEALRSIHDAPTIEEGLHHFAGLADLTLKAAQVHATLATVIEPLDLDKF